MRITDSVQFQRNPGKAPAFVPLHKAAIRLRWIGIGLLLVPPLVEWSFLDTHGFGRASDPVLASLRAALSATKPYFVLALALLLFRFFIARLPSDRSISASKSSIPLLVCAVILALGAGAVQPGLKEALSRGDFTIGEEWAGHKRIYIGRSAFFGPAYPLELVPFEDAASLMREEIAPQNRPRDVLVRWYGARLVPEVMTGRFTLSAGGSKRDVTDDLLALKPGKARLFSHAVRVGPGPATVQLQVSGQILPPKTFLDADRDSNPQGLSIEAGGGDQAFQAEWVPRSSAGALRRSLVIEGHHTAGGYSVVVLSGAKWDQHDLSNLTTNQGVIEIELAPPDSRMTGDDAPPWAFLFVSQGKETREIPLSRFSATERGMVLRYPLNAVDWREVPPTNVVGAAFRYQGKPGPFQLSIRRIQAAPASRLATGFALGATNALDPRKAPQVGIFTVNLESKPSYQGRLAVSLRLAAGVLALVGMLGFATAWRLIRSFPLVALSSLAFSVLFVTLSVFALPALMEPRLEHAPLLMILTGLMLAMLRSNGHQPSVSGAKEAPVFSAESREANYQWLDALKVTAAFGVIAIHVTADSAGMPFPAYPADERIFPLVARAVAMGFNYHIFLIASFFLLAQSLERRERSYGTVIVERCRRLLPAFLAWTVFFVFFRLWKAYVFGYAAPLQRELATTSSWFSYLILGNGQYHLHFVPLLIALTFFYPLYRQAVQKPWLGGAAVVLLLSLPFLEQFVYQHVVFTSSRDYLLFLMKVVAYASYGFIAFSFYGLFKQGIAGRLRTAAWVGVVVVVITSLAVLIKSALKSGTLGRWAPFDVTTHAAVALFPAAIFLLFLLIGHFRFPHPLTKLAPLGFGIYLIHPMFLDALEILQKGWTAHPLLTSSINFVIVSFAATVSVALIKRWPATAWLTGERIGR